MFRRSLPLLATLLAFTIIGCGKKSPTGPSPESGTKIIDVKGDLAFGNVHVNTVAARTFTISNSGTASLSFTGFTAQGGTGSAGFAASPLTGTVPAGSSRTITVQFAPTEPKFYSAVLHVTGDQTAGNEAINISGTGTADLPIIDSFTADPSVIDPGQSSTLNWSVRNATSASIKPSPGDVPLSGSAVVSPVISVTYTLTATNADGASTKTVMVRLNVPDVEYVVTGTPRASVITYSGRNESTLQASSANLPWSYQFSPAKTGDFLYVSAQNDAASGCITVQIKKRGSVYRDATSCGAYVIATASGSW